MLKLIQLFMLVHYLLVHSGEAAKDSKCGDGSARCPSILLLPGSECTNVKDGDPTKPFPECCPSLHCDSGEY
ncbi:hypothetical protein ILUMI_00822 [Ignelater luminosus]|uniref:Uncharacterized protein n=1 Tax=Ignelater luminosus TaxID=2038154 RepID=A0A8K0DLJ3_IGNLU|nr:hypothetical protein ILUMI_00822 [Ignelater luminosus]